MHLQTLQRRLALAVAENPSATHVAVPIASIRGIIKDLKRGGSPVDALSLPVVDIAKPTSKAFKAKQVRLPKKISSLPGFADLSYRSKRVLAENGVVLTSQLKAMNESDLSQMYGMGAKSVNEVMAWAKKTGAHRG